LDENDLKQIQNEVYNLSKWFDQPEIRNHIIFEDVNVGRLFHEQFSEFLVKFLKKYREIYNIFTKYQNSTYLASGRAYRIICLFTESVEKIQENKQESIFIFDKVRFDLKIGGKYFMLFLSRKYYLKLKKISEIVTNFCFGPRKISKKTTLLVEIHTIRYKKLLKIKDQTLNLFFYGRRRPAIWNLETYNIFRKSNSKIITSYALMDKKFNRIVQNKNDELTDKIKKFANTSIDISDGLITDLDKLINNQKLSYKLFLKDIPISNNLKKILVHKKLSKVNCIFNGDDYQILFTASKNKRRIIRKIATNFRIKLTKIGLTQNIAKKSSIVDDKSIQINLNNKGYFHKF